MPPLCSRSPSPPSSSGSSSSSSHRRARHVAPLVAGMTAIAIATTRRDGEKSERGVLVGEERGFRLAFSWRKDEAAAATTAPLAVPSPSPPPSPFPRSSCVGCHLRGWREGGKSKLGFSRDLSASSGGYSGVRPFPFRFSSSPEMRWLRRSSAMKFQWRLVGFSHFIAKRRRPPLGTCVGWEEAGGTHTHSEIDRIVVPCSLCFMEC